MADGDIKEDASGNALLNAAGDLTSDCGGAVDCPQCDTGTTPASYALTISSVVFSCISNKKMSGTLAGTYELLQDGSNPCRFFCDGPELSWDNYSGGCSALTTNIWSGTSLLELLWDPSTPGFGDVPDLVVWGPMDSGGTGLRDLVCFALDPNGNDCSTEWDVDTELGAPASHGVASHVVLTALP